LKTLRYPLCNSEIHQLGVIGIEDQGLPQNHSSDEESIFFYECKQCYIHEQKDFAYQRVLVDGKWYFFNYCKWNLLKEETLDFNPSRREKNVLD
jgi:hypothetical protein